MLNPLEKLSKKEKVNKSYDLTAIRKKNLTQIDKLPVQQKRLDTSMEEKLYH